MLQRGHVLKVHLESETSYFVLSRSQVCVMKIFENND